MHRCLEIDEILHRIASHVEGKVSLVNMALTTHTFYEPAMDWCWYDVDFRVLLQLLPPDALHISVEGPDWYRVELWVSSSNLYAVKL